MSTGRVILVRGSKVLTMLFSRGVGFSNTECMKLTFIGISQLKAVIITYPFYDRQAKSKAFL